MNILDPKKKNNPFEYIFWFQFAKTVVVKCLKLISNHSGIISGTYFSPFQGSLTQTGASEAETSEILVSREFSRIFFHFHFSFSISSRFNFTFTSRKRVKGFYFSLFTSRKK